MQEDLISQSQIKPAINQKKGGKGKYTNISTTSTYWVPSVSDHILGGVCRQNRFPSVELIFLQIARLQNKNLWYVNFWVVKPWGDF
jgi:hypothetical protein